MATHRERIEQAEREVVEAAIAQSHCTEYHGELECVRKRLHPAVDALLALRAACCPECGGSGARHLMQPHEAPCPAGCDNGRRRDA